MSKIFKGNKKFIILFSVSLAFLFSVGIVMPALAGGASLYLSPSSGSYKVGDAFSVAIMVDTGGVAINAAEANLSFDSGKLDVVSISKSGSIFTMWVKEPGASGGTISFGGGLPAPGYNGSAGKIITINFKAKTEGEAKVNFSSGQVLPNSPNPTNILTSTGSGTYTISVTPPPTPVPKKAEITSSTHPDQNKWYQNNSPQFSWKLPSDITGVSFSFDQKENGFPDNISEGLVNSKQYENVEDGIWYFHLRFHKKNGWNGVSHYKVQIDTTSPDHFEIIVDNEGDPTNPRPILFFETTDKTSGIDFYEVKIGEGEIESVTAEQIKANPYRMPLQAPGKHTVIVKAVDKAGNYVLAMTEIAIEAIEAPKITEYPKILYFGDPFIIKGTSLPEIIINIYLQKEGEEEVVKTTTKSDKEGNFTYSHDRLLERGIYKLWIEAEDSRGAKSNPSEKLSISVAPPAFVRIGSLVIDYLSTIIVLLILIAVLVLGSWWGWRKIKERRRRLKKEITEAEKALYQAFKDLREETREQVAKLDGRPDLSAREKKICDELKKALKISEEFIGKEIKDIEKELHSKSNL